MLSKSIFSISHFIFILTIVISLIALRRRSFLEKLMFSPYHVIHKNRWYLLLTSGLVHGDFMHLFFNMLTFYFFAFDLAYAVGEINFFIIYICSLILSHLPTLIRHKDNYYYRSLGASGAISGILFSSILIYPTNRIMFFPIPIPIPSAIFGVIYLLWCKFADRRIDDGINHSAHFAGAIVGIIVSFILFPEEIIMIWQNFLM